MNRSVKYIEKEKCRSKVAEKEEAKERARFVSLAMLRLWRAECRRCIGRGVGVQLEVHAQTGNTDDFLKKNNDYLPGSISFSAASLNCNSTSNHSSSSSYSCSGRNSGSRSGSGGSGSLGKNSTRGGYEVLGRTLAEWEMFVLEGPENRKRYCNGSSFI